MLKLLDQEIQETPISAPSRDYPDGYIALWRSPEALDFDAVMKEHRGEVEDRVAHYGGILIPETLEGDLPAAHDIIQPPTEKFLPFHGDGLDMLFWRLKNRNQLRVFPTPSTPRVDFVAASIHTAAYLYPFSSGAFKETLNRVRNWDPNNEVGLVIYLSELGPKISDPEQARDFRHFTRLSYDFCNTRFDMNWKLFPRAMHALYSGPEEEVSLVLHARLTPESAIFEPSLVGGHLSTYGYDFKTRFSVSQAHPYEKAA